MSYADGSKLKNIIVQPQYSLAGRVTDSINWVMYTIDIFQAMEEATVTDELQEDIDT